MPLSKRKRSKIEQIIKDNHLAFMVEVLGPASIPPEELDRLVKAGKVKLPASPATTAGKAAASVKAAHEVGVLVAKLGEKTAKKMKAGTFWEYTTKVAPPELSVHELEAIKLIEDKVGLHIQGLGNKLVDKLGMHILEEDAKLRRKLLTTVRAEVKAGIEEQKSYKTVATAMARATDNNKRDWLQIAHTEMHSALEEGKANAIMREVPGTDPLVYKRPRPDACPFCKLLYMDGAKPRVFRLSELSANGTNVGRKARRPHLTGPHATEWKPVVGVMHPWCQCSLHHMMEGFDFDKDGNLVYVGDTKKSVHVDTLDADLLKHECC